jgi:hypothetical protein
MRRPDCVMSTAAHAIGDMADFLNPNVVKVVLDRQQTALYFSRAPIAWWRDGMAEGSPRTTLPSPAPLRHIGIYGYRAGFLRQFPALEPWPPGNHRSAGATAGAVARTSHRRASESDGARSRCGHTGRSGTRARPVRQDLIPRGHTSRTLHRCKRAAGTRMLSSIRRLDPPCQKAAAETSGLDLKL